MRLTTIALIVANIGYCSEVLTRLEERQAAWRLVVGDANSKAVRREAASFLKQSTQPLAAIVVAQSKQAASDATGKGSTDVGYSAWQNRLRSRTSEKCLPLIFGLRIGPDSALRSVDEECHITQMQTSGSKDPFLLKLDGYEGRILHVSIQKARLGNPPLWALYFIMTGSPLSEHLARSFLESLQHAAPMPNATVVLRNDPWFITSDRFPLVYELNGAPTKLPTEEQFEEAPEVRCGLVSNTEINCWNSNVSPKE